jgi:hypothetical protein
MLKKYAEPNHLRLVGKAWEIRNALRQEQRVRGGDLPLSELLSPNRSKRK